MVMELCEWGNLHDLYKKEKFTVMQKPDMIKALFVQICHGVSAIHSKIGHAHLNLNLKNILVGADYKLKVCGLSSA